MINTELKIHQLVDSAYVDWNIDLMDTVPIPVSRSIIDINDFASRTADHTFTITIPGTNNNNKVFSNIFKLDWALSNTDLTQNYDTQFNPTLKASATLYTNGVVQLTGHLQLMSINQIDEQRIEYEVILIGTLGTLFSDLGDLKLSEANVSGMHAYTKANIVASWTAPLGVDYVYPLIDYGVVSNERDYYVDNLYPAVYVKTIVDAIFRDAGYRYQSSFFNSTRFKSLIVPFSGKTLRLSAEEITDRTFLADRNSDSAYATINNYNDQAANIITLPFDQNPTPSNPSGYNTGSYEFTIQTGKNGKYIFRSDFQITIKNNGGASLVFWDFVGDIKCNGLSVAGKVLNAGGTLGAGLDTTIPDFLATPEMYFNAGDVIKVDIRIRHNGTMQYKLKDNSTFYNIPVAQITEGQDIVLADTLPSDVTQHDFLISIFKMFNLYCEFDTLDTKKLIIEPRDDFYNNTIVDLTDYVDVQSGIKSEPMGALRFKTYQYTYQTDEDLKNTLHTDKFVDPYGQRRFSIVNDFVTDEYKTEIVFAASPLSDRPNLTTRVLTRIWFNDPNQQKAESSTAKIRILYYGGVITPTNALYENWYIKSRDGSSDLYTDYPYAGHLDNPLDPEFDLCFGAPVQVQYNAELYTDNNLFNVYHKKGVEEIIDPDSRIVTFKMWLNDVQRSQLSFRNNYFINKQYYRLYEVGYDASSADLTEVKFLKLKTAPAFVGSQSTLNGGDTGLGDQGDGDPIWIVDSFRNSNAFPKGSDNVTLGENNAVNGDKSLLNSQGNIIGSDYASVLGGSGNQTTYDGVTLLGCNDYVTTVEGEQVINNIQQPFLYTAVFDKYDVSGINTTPVSVMPSYPGYWTEVVDAYVSVYFDGVAPVAFNSHKICLRYNSSTTHICEFDAGITAVTTGTKQRGNTIIDIPFLEDSIDLEAHGALGDSGSGQIQIDIFYRLHKIKL